VGTAIIHNLSYLLAVSSVPSPNQLKRKGTITKRGGIKIDKIFANQNRLIMAAKILQERF